MIKKLKIIMLILCLSSFQLQASNKSKNNCHWLKKAFIYSLLFFSPAAAVHTITEVNPYPINPHRNPSNFKKAHLRHRYNTQNIIGEDDREPVVDMEYPATAVGQFHYDDGEHAYRCSGFMPNPYLVITNHHCLKLNESGISPSFWTNTTFYLGYQSGTYLEKSVPYKIEYPGGDYDLTNDWAIIQLVRPIANKYGWIEIILRTMNQINADHPENIIHISYPSDILEEFDTPAKQQNCQTRGLIIRGRVMRATFDCDTMEGTAGGPLIILTEDGKYAVIGINNAEAVVNGSHVPEEDFKNFPNLFQPSELFYANFIDFQIEIPPGDIDVEPVETNPDYRPSQKPVPSTSTSISPSSSPSPDTLSPSPSKTNNSSTPEPSPSTENEPIFECSATKLTAFLATTALSTLLLFL